MDEDQDVVDEYKKEDCAVVGSNEFDGKDFNNLRLGFSCRL